MPTTPITTRPYQCSCRTSLGARAVLDELATRRIPDVEVSERGPSYLVLERPRRQLYGGQTAVFMSVAIVIIALMLTAVTPVFSVLLLAALLPFVPLVVLHRPSLAVSAVIDPDGATRINAHGEASPELAAALDAFVAGLPTDDMPPPPPATPTSGPPNGDASPPIAPSGPPIASPPPEPPTQGPTDAPSASALAPNDAPNSPSSALAAERRATARPPKPVDTTEPVPLRKVRVVAKPENSAPATPGAPSGAVVLFNPACSHCREACGILEAEGIPITLIRYLENVPTRTAIVDLLDKLGATDPREMMRTNEPIYTELRLATASRDRLITAMLEHPSLIQRPIVVRDGRAVVARPTDRVRELIAPPRPRRKAAQRKA